MIPRYRWTALAWLFAIAVFAAERPLPNQPVILVDRGLATGARQDSSLNRLYSTLGDLRKNRPDNVSAGRWESMIDDQQARLLRVKLSIALQESRVEAADSLSHEMLLLSPSPENHAALGSVLEAEHRWNEALAAWVTGAVLTRAPGAKVHAESLYNARGYTPGEYPAFYDRYRQNVLALEAGRAQTAAKALNVLPADILPAGESPDGFVLIFWDESLGDEDEAVVIEAKTVCESRRIPYRLVYAGILDQLPVRQAKRFGLSGSNDLEPDHALARQLKPNRLPAILVADQERRPKAWFPVPNRLLPACMQYAWENVQQR